MKKLILILALVMLCAGIGAGLILTQINNPVFKSRIESGISDATGHDVSIGQIGLGWRRGLSLTIKNFRLSAAQPDVFVSSVQAAQVHVVLELGPLLRRELALRSLFIEKPVIVLQRPHSAQDGGLSVSTQAPETTQAQSAPSFYLEEFQIRDGKIVIHDAQMAAPLEIRKVNLRLRNFSLDKPFDFELNAAVSSERQNMKMSGVVTPSLDKPFTIRHFQAETDLGLFLLPELEAVTPFIHKSGLRRMSGQLILGVDNLVLDEDPLDDVEGTLELKNGYFETSHTAVPVKEVFLTALLKENTINLDAFQARIGDGEFAMKGRVENYRYAPVSHVSFLLKDLSLSDVTPRAKGARLSGLIGLRFDGSARGSAWPSIAGSLTGQGELTIREGVILDYNITRKAAEKLSLIPGAGEWILKGIPAEYQSRINEPHMILQPVSIPIQARQGVLYADSLRIVSDLVIIEGRGAFGLDQSVDMETSLKIHPNVSQGMARYAPQISVLFNPEGEIQVPFRVRGRLGDLKMILDKEYLMSRLAVAATQQVMSNLLQKSAQVQQPLSQTVDADGLKNLFKRELSALTGKSSDQ